MTEQDRKEFEAWASGRYGLIQQDFLRGVDGYYCKMTRLAYASWLAARRSQSEQVRELVEAVKYARRMMKPDTDTAYVDAALAQQDQPAGEVLDADTLTIYFRGDITKPHSLTSEDYDKLKASGMLWELYPDAPDHFIAATAR